MATRREEGGDGGASARSRITRTNAFRAQCMAVPYSTTVSNANETEKEGTKNGPWEGASVGNWHVLVVLVHTAKNLGGISDNSSSDAP